ncbi:MAG: hypothetical protein ACK57P_07445, partial [Planctomycetota bacterium]
HRILNNPKFLPDFSFISVLQSLKPWKVRGISTQNPCSMRSCGSWSSPWLQRNNATTQQRNNATTQQRNNATTQIFLLRGVVDGSLVSGL